MITCPPISMSIYLYSLTFPYILACHVFTCTCSFRCSRIYEHVPVIYLFMCSSVTTCANIHSGVHIYLRSYPYLCLVIYFHLFTHLLHEDILLIFIHLTLHEDILFIFIHLTYFSEIHVFSPTYSMCLF